jgi:hypothetical protein
MSKMKNESSNPDFFFQEFIWVCIFIYLLIYIKSTTYIEQCYYYFSLKPREIMSNTFIASSAALVK